MDLLDPEFHVDRWDAYLWLRNLVSTLRKRDIPRSGCSATAPEAPAYATKRSFGKVVRLEDDVERNDIYGRWLAYLYLVGENIEEERLRKGCARLLVIEPNHTHARAMLDDELNAGARRVGLWGACDDGP